MAEFKYPAQKVSWTKRDVILFAHSIGCNSKEQLHFLYEHHPNFQVFPTYPIVLTFKYDEQDVVDFLARNAAAPIPPGCPSLDWSQAVDGRRRILLERELPPTSESRSWEIRSKVIGIYDKGPGKGTIMEREHVLVDSNTNEVYSRAWETAIFLKSGGWGGDRGPRIVRYSPPEHRSPDAVVDHQTMPETAHLYRLNGDYNPLHASPEAGAALGYGGIIMHGLYSWNVAARIILDKYGANKGSNLRDFEARFTAPVKPGDKLKVKMWEMDLIAHETGQKLLEVRFVVEVAAKVVLSDGRALLTPPHTAPML
ncbi:hypothetical protein VTN31DRAFT_1566 [Thermomyces dupontii]|uniref:uncharacterized protein n=1 Tax=Talaromyces thermophilus TaxID=28565 RepID=UPI003741EE12